AAPIPDGTPVSSFHSSLPLARSRARHALLPTTSTALPKTPARYRSSACLAFRHTSAPSRRFRQWTEPSSGAVKTTLPSTITGAVFRHSGDGGGGPGNGSGLPRGGGGAA